ncbi:hypothetical protein [Arthrobacter sp. zg-Y1110]|uniref:hypothetical protein n=1 Tax=Arthrobacter sp. zg-Y1110 TaxID=2886932 RepID=UPI001D146456|nr:hypothetical protein [Arthrobacter sp. zg-Y1110]MCC3292527.1 hypothetical protein [Arthrobacter sp. zg-Y1110]UWX87041.1 hypothetical protein N2K99_16960 [Arthrobacter sp. zg-Y1110]
MTTTAEPAAAGKDMHSLQSIDALPEGTIITVGTLVAEAGPQGWLLTGRKKPMNTWGLVSRAGTLNATVLRVGRN